MRMKLTGARTLRRQEQGRDAQPRLCRRPQLMRHPLGACDRKGVQV